MFNVINIVINFFSSIYNMCCFDNSSKEEKEQLIKKEKDSAINYKLANIEPLDVIVFRGSDFVSNTIRWLSKKSMGGRYEAGCFSHVGVIVTKEMLNLPEMEEGKLYIWESTISGRLGGNVKNINNETFLGVQIRDFDEVIKNYCTDNTAIAVLKLINRRALDCDVSEKLMPIYKKYNGTRYEINPMQLFGALFPKVRCLRINYGIDKFLFCSELVSMIYCNLNIFPENVHPYDVVPADFVSEGDQDRLSLYQYFEKFVFLKID